jgi:hypothetical protein
MIISDNAAMGMTNLFPCDSNNYHNSFLFANEVKEILTSTFCKEQYCDVFSVTGACGRCSQVVSDTNSPRVLVSATSN